MQSRGLAVATISTRSHLHTTLVMIESIRATWPGKVPIYVALIDGDENGLDDAFKASDVVAIDASTVGAPDWAWLVTKFNAMEISCCVKPFVISALFDRGHDSVFYIDGDILFLADGEPTARYRPDAPFVVIPHMLSPTTHDPLRLRPPIAEIATAGMMNAGMFVARDQPQTRQFLTTWGDLVTRPGACVPELSGVRDQQLFNWVTSFVDDVAVLRDPCVNIAYWNLHERPIRAVAGGQRPQWTLDARPVSSFHFSGFDPNSEGVSRYDGAGAIVDPHVDALCTLYSELLADARERLGPPADYAYGAIDGIALVDVMRDQLRRDEAWSGTPHWIDGAWEDVARASLSSIATTLAAQPAPLIPAFAATVIGPRTDLARLYEPDELYAQHLLDWLRSASFAREHHEGRFYEQHCSVAIARNTAADLAAAATRMCDGLSVDMAHKMLRDDRPRLLELVAGTELATVIAAGVYKFPAHEPACCLRRIYQSRVDLMEAFPDPLCRDLTSFSSWLETRLAAEYELPETVAALAARFDVAGALARILGRIQRHPVLRERVRQHGLGVDTVRDLRREATGAHGFSITDLALAEWWTHERPEAERRALVADVFPRVTVRAAPHGVGIGHNTNGLNLFGQFKSPNGLGSLSHGLAVAAEQEGLDCRRVLLTNATMDPGLSLADLQARGDPTFARDVAISFPHLDFDLFEAFPDALGERESIVYLAWELRHCSRYWAKRFERFDRLFALSSFAAESISTAFRRPCDVLPAVVQPRDRVGNADITALRAELGIDPDAFVVGTIFDSASGLERKNPVAAARAVAAAFGGRRDVVFVVKASNGAQLQYTRRLREALRVLDDAGVDHRLITAFLPRSKVDALTAALDVFVSLHRAEGFGYTMAEAMLHEVPVVATRYSGNLDFTTEDNSYLVDYSEVPLAYPEGPFAVGSVWAEADVDDAAARLRHIYDNRSEAAARGARARETVIERCSPAAVGKRLRALLS